MATLNPDQATDFGVIMYALGQNFSNSYGGFILPWQNPNSPGVVDSYTYSYGTVYNPTTNGQLTSQTGPNVQAALNLLSDANSISPGFTLTFHGTGEQGSGTISLNYYDTSSMVIDAQPLPSGSSNVDLSTSTLTSNQPSEVVAASTLEFVFIPGSTQTLALNYTTGTTISEATTNGITNVTTNSEGVTVGGSVTETVKVTEGVPDDQAEVSDSVTESINAAWSESTSQSTNYSTTTTNQTNTTISSTITVNVNTATPNADGTYTYGDLTLIPGNTYVAYIEISSASYSSAVMQNFQIYGPNSSTNLEYTASSDGNSYSDSTDLFAVEVNVDYNPMESIQNANHWGYNELSLIDPSIFQYVTGNTDMVVYSGLVTANSVGSANAQVIIQAVSNTTTADNTSTPASAAYAVSVSASAPQASHSSAMLDLALAASRLQSTNGVYFDTTGSGVESALMSKYLGNNESGLITIKGGDHDAVFLGNLNYELTGFSHSNVTVGNGSNSISVGPTENGNLIRFGDGNNAISLGGLGNNFYLGKGQNFIDVTGATGKNFVIDSDGGTALMINDASGFTQVSNWDQTQDSLHFGSNLDLSDVKVTFNYDNWSYNVYVEDHLVANLITVGGLSYSDPTTKITYTSAYAPTSIAILTNEGFVTGLYADAFERAPDSAGFAYWTNELAQGETRDQVIQTFFTSAEFESQFQTSSQYVAALYHDLLGRTADSNGLAYWSEAIDAGASDASVISGFLNSAEFTQLVGNNLLT